MSKVVVIGSGFSGLASAGLLAKAGHEVTVLEKNNSIGGRARHFTQDGFVFDMGPSWYWMPEVFEQFFGYFGNGSSDFYDLRRLDPAFRIFFEEDIMDVPGNPAGVYELFEKTEKGAAKKLDRYMNEAEYKYDVGVRDIIYRQPDGLKPFLNWKTIAASTRLQLFTSLSDHIARNFKHPHLRQLLEFPVLFLGSSPDKTPALYSLMDFSGLMQGTWYPMGGFRSVVDAFHTIAKNEEVQFITNAEVQSISHNNQRCLEVSGTGGSYGADGFVVSSDYHSFDQHILPKDQVQYSPEYWDTREMAPSSVLFYLGHKGKVDGLEHHNLFFDRDFKAHSGTIYTTKDWPEDPLFYVCCPSKTDASVAPEGHENLFVLIPIAPGLHEDQALMDHYYDLVMNRIEKRIGTDLRPGIVYRRDYCTADFIKDYRAFKGNAYGLANTLKQTAFLKPRMKHKRLENVFFAGQLTNPGPGVPPSIVSGELAAKYFMDYSNRAL